MTFKNSILIIIFLIIFTGSSIFAEKSPEYTGIVKKKSGTAVTIQMDGKYKIAAGSKIDVFTFFRQNILGMDTTGWLHAAEADLTSIKDTIAVIKVITELSPMTVNSKKVDHLMPGTKIKLVVK